MRFALTRTEGARDARPALRASLLRAIFNRRFGSSERALCWRVPSERQAANDDIRSNILESPRYFVADIKLRLGGTEVALESQPT